MAHARLRAARRRHPALTALLDGKYAEIRELTRKNLVEYADILDDAIEMPRDQFRERVLEVVKEMAATGATGLGFPTEYGGGGDIGASVAAFETLGFGDLSVLVKVGVQFGLFGGAILQLGSKRHHDAYLEDLVTGELMGCFAMTETGHGSNVQALGTVATYDTESREFVITTPDDRSRKDYIGNAAAHAQRAVVFAQLQIGGESDGVHAFVVPIRAAGRSRSTASGSRTTGQDRASTASTTAGCGSTGCGCRARRCSTGSPTSPRTVLRSRHRERRPPLLHDARAPWSRAGSASAVPASTPPRSR